ncbi:MAG: ABC transporter ATP-binding protein [Actinomycetota bacterium]
MSEQHTFGVDRLTVELGATLALSGITLAVPPGAVTAVVGGDGAGKTTLLRCLVGEVRPTSGTVRRPGKHHLGYMPSTSGVWRDLSVAENVAFAATAYGIAPDTDRPLALLRAARLDDFTDRLAGDLSGGMRQKLGVVMAMLHEPALIVLDEPSTGVDPVSRVELWRLISEAAARGAAVLLATTYIDEAERASSLLVLDEGRLLVEGDAASITAAVPGTLMATTTPIDRGHAWRRGTRFHEWRPTGVDDTDDTGEIADASALTITPDLEDAVIIEMLSRRAVAT